MSEFELVVIESIQRIHNSVLAEVTKQIAGLRGPRGLDGVNGIDGKGFVFEEHESKVREILSSLKIAFSDLTSEQVQALKGADGKHGKDFNLEEARPVINESVERVITSLKESLKLKFSDLTAEEVKSLKGIDGRDGKDFNFEENAGTIRAVISSAVSETFSQRKDELKLRFQDLSESDKQELKGPKGDNGRDFDFEEHRASIDSLLNKIFIRSIPSLKLRFSDLTEEEKESLRGPQGRDGKDFDFEQHKEFVKTLPLSVDNLSIEQRDQLRLKFSDLTEEEISRLRGPRGQRGRTGENGKDFIFDEHKNEISALIVSVLPKKEELALRFDDLTLEQKNELKGERGEKGEKGESIVGPQGETGAPGRNGRDFIFQEHEPRITEIITSIIPKKEDLALTFDRLTPDEKLQLRGEKGDVGERGPRGQRGQKGDDGQSAPRIKSVKSISVKDGIRLIFHFTDDTKVASDLIELKVSPVTGSSKELLHAICGPEMYVGAAVYLLEVEGQRVAKLAKADSDETSNFFGFVEKIQDESCYISFTGITSEVFSDLNPIKTYYLSDEHAGEIMPFPPENSGSFSVRVGQPSNSKSMLIRVGDRIPVL